jgi:hypothetical protein
MGQEEGLDCRMIVFGVLSFERCNILDDAQELGVMPSYRQ